MACALRALGPVLEISFGPPSADFGGLFGPPKKRVNFDMFKKHQKCVLCILSPNNLTKINYCCPTVFYQIQYEYLIFVLFLLLGFCLSPRVVWSPKPLLLLSFWVLQLFGPPGMPAALLHFKIGGFIIAHICHYRYFNL